MPRVLGAIFYTAPMEIPHFLMERKMLLGIRARAERTYAAFGTVLQGAGASVPTSTAERF